MSALLQKSNRRYELAYRKALGDELSTDERHELIALDKELSNLGNAPLPLSTEVQEVLEELGFWSDEE